MLHHILKFPTLRLRGPHSSAAAPAVGAEVGTRSSASYPWFMRLGRAASTPLASVVGGLGGGSAYESLVIRVHGKAPLRTSPTHGESGADEK